MDSSAAHAAVIAQAIKASGAIVRIAPAEFVRLLGRGDAPLVVASYGGLLQKRYQYLTSYKGLVFHTKSPDQLALPRTCEVIEAEQIWIPA
jgi:hypothetical protein